MNTFWRALSYTDQLAYDADNSRTFADRPFWLWGGSFGGPILQDRTFFWWSAEGNNDVLAENTEVILPTAAEASGDFSASGTTIYNPFDLDANGNRRPFPGNVIPAHMIDPAGRGLAQLLTTLGPGGGVSSSGAQTTTALQSTGNVSHTFSDAWQSSLTYLYYTSKEGAFQQYTDLLGGGQRSRFRHWRGGPAARRACRRLQQHLHHRRYLGSDAALRTDVLQRLRHQSGVRG